MKPLHVSILGSIALLVALVFAVLPKVIGLSIEQATINSLIELLPPEAESQLEVRRIEFREGWFNSAATIELLYMPIGTEDLALSLEFDIDHGPLLQTADGFAFGLAYANIETSIRNDLFDVAIADIEIPLPETAIELLVRFDQSLRLGLQVGTAEYSGAEGEIGFEGLEARLEAAADQSAQFTLEMGELSATEIAANSNMRIAGLRVESATARMNDILAESSAAVTIPSISSSAPLPFSIGDISISWGLRASETTAGSSEVFQTIRVASIESEVPLNALSWTSEIKLLKNELLLDYYRLLSEIQNEYSTETDTISNELNALGQELLLLTLQNPLEMNNHIELSSYGGEHSADLLMQWSGLDSLASVDVLDIGAAIAALDVSLSISLELEAVLRSPLSGLVDPYVQQGYLTVNNGRVVVEASLQNSVLKVNGDELPLDQFF